MLDTITIAVDAMGGDTGPRVTIPAVLQCLANDPNLKIILVGDETKLVRYLKAKKVKPKHDRVADRLEIKHASEHVEMDESPTQALRTKKDSSMRIAINLVKEGKANACVSAGNTGALMMTARFVLSMLPGIDRPAIVSAFPTMSDEQVPTHMLDLGANVDANAEHLFQFAVMGSILASITHGLDNPRVGILNIGEEDIKGNDLVRKTVPLLSESPFINYTGYLEADKLFHGGADVVVCDGFVGNVALKSIEGTMRAGSTLVKEAFRRNIVTKLIGLLVLPVFRGVKKRFDPARYNGATLLGLQGIVVKSHGGTTVNGFVHAVEQAKLEVKHDLINLIRRQVSDILSETE